jgi:hypothetical protein
MEVAWALLLTRNCRSRVAGMSSSFARLVAGYVEHYNNVRLNGAVGYITPKDLLTGRQQEIHAGRDRKLAEHGNGGRFAGRTAA